MYAITRAIQFAFSLPIYENWMHYCSYIRCKKNSGKWKIRQWNLRKNGQIEVDFRDPSRWKYWTRISSTDVYKKGKQFFVF